VKTTTAPGEGGATGTETETFSSIIKIN